MVLTSALFFLPSFFLPRLLKIKTKCHDNVEDDISKLFFPPFPGSLGLWQEKLCPAMMLSHLVAHVSYLAFDSQNVFHGLWEFTNY